jgi:DNA mismatch repair protein MutL
MSDIIRLLPDSIANQIAAGEVVQRPASVVKELLENAIDAQATRIDLLVKEAGKTLIQVIDNGIGMSETDARMCFERHATSKIQTSDDLFRIRTMGFRGEAMASIAAVAQVELRTRRAADELGTLLRIEASEVKTQEAISAPEGTNLLVKNLFFNVPARRNFLKSNPVEMRHILDEFHRVALAHPDITFTLQHGVSEVYTLPAGKLSKRIVDIFGKNYREQLAACEEETPYVSVRGYVGKPDSAKKSRTEQFFFVNNRFIKNSYLHHAVLTAFEGLVPEGTHPFYVIFIEIDPSHIDINVHPTKTEIKFDDERSVYGIVAAAVRRAMNVYNLSPSLDFENDFNALFDQNFSSKNKIQTAQSDNDQAVTRPNLSNGRPSQEPRLEGERGARARSSDWRQLYEGLDSSRLVQRFEQATPPSQQRFDFAQPDDSPAAVTIQSKANRLGQSPSSPAGTLTDGEATTFQVHKRYIVSQVRSGMLLIDQRAAYERIVFEQYQQAQQKRTASSQQLLFPKTIRLNPADFQLMSEMLDEIKYLGFDLSVIGHDALMVNGIPADMPDEDAQQLIEGLLEQFKRNQDELKLPHADNLARSLAKRVASRYVQALTVLEMNNLVEQLFASSNPSYTPSGEPTMRILGMEELADFFKK